VDPVTLVVTAVALGASAGLTDTATTAVKDAYAGLKGLLGRRSIDVSGVERRPGSTAQQNALHEDLADAAESVDDELLAAARAVTDAVATHDAAAAQAIGVDLSDVQAAFIKIGSVASTGTGVRIHGADVSGGIAVDEVRAGGSPDPSPR
jgi:hypothetical protein